MIPLPGYDELPLNDALGLPHSWDLFGRDDALGTLNLLTPEVVKAATVEVRDGTVVSLNLPADQPSPPLFDREPYRHEGFWLDRNTWDDKLDGWYPQSSTQWDGFRHFRAREQGFYGGRTGDDPRGIGIEHWADHGIVGRGVLLDVEAHLAASGGVPFDERFVVTAQTLRETAESQGVSVTPGDIVLIRTAWPAKYHAAGTGLNGKTTLPGIEAGEATARLLWDWHVAAVATDLPAVEPAPGDPADGSLHRRLLALLGIPMGELFDLESLSAACIAAGRHSFLFTSSPMALPEGAGSPGNALAIL